MNTTLGETWEPKIGERPDAELMAERKEFFGASVPERVAYPGWMAQKWTYIPRELPGGRPSFIHVFEPLEDGQTRGANVFYSVMEQMKMLDTLQNTQLQSGK